MKTIHKIWIVIAVCAVLIIGLSLATHVPKTVRHVRIGYLPVVHALPLFMAVEKGYFKEANIDVTLAKFEAPNQIIDALLSNNIDMAMAAATGITAVADSKKPGSLKIFAIQGGDDDHVADALLVSKDSTAHSIEDLRGKKVGVLPGIQWRTLSRNIFAQYELDIDKDIALVELAVPLQAQALATKQIDALLTIEPVITIANSMGVSRTLVQSPNLTAVSNPFYAGVGNVSTEFIRTQPELFKDIMSIMNKATAEVDRDTVVARQYLVNYTPLSLDLAKIVSLPIYKMYTAMNEPDRMAVQKFIDVFIKYKVIETPMSATDLIYHD